MPSSQEFILGEHICILDERYRLSVPQQLHELLAIKAKECVLVKERAGCISLWNPAVWQTKLDDRVELIRQKIKSGVIEDRITEFQLLGRLLSTRHKVVPLSARGRLSIPKGFREFLKIEEPEREVMVVGAALCVEIWNTNAWLEYIEERMPEFQKLFNELSQ